MVSSNWISQGTKQARKDDRWFRDVTKNCIKQLRNGINTYCFSYEQVEYIKERTPKLKVIEIFEEEDGIYNLFYRGRVQ